MDDLISRKRVLALPRNKVRSLRTYEVIEETINVTDIERLPSTQPDNRLSKIADLVDGTIDHFDLDDAMDLLYQIKDVLR